MLWKCSKESYETEEERGKKKKKKVTDSKPDICLQHVLSRNEGDTMRIKIPSWKLEFGHKNDVVHTIQKVQSTHACLREFHLQPIFLN